MTFSRRMHLVLAAVAFALAIILVLLAIDVRRAHEALALGDARFPASPVEHALWNPPKILPLDLGQRVLGVRDDLEYRRALQLFRVGRPLEAAQQPLTAVRARAQSELTQVVRYDSNPQRRAEAANLLGILSFAVQSDEDPTVGAALFEAAVTDFRNAIILDPSNEDAKYNLELSLLTESQEQLPPTRSNRPNPGQQGAGAGAGAEGTGY